MTILAAGTVLWRPAQSDEDGAIEIALVHRPKYDDWSLPKGKCEPQEHPVQTAVRETAEETGFSGPVTRFVGQLRYAVQHGGSVEPKTVDYWAMPAIGGAFTASAEVDQVAWLPPRAARAQLTRPADRAPLDAFLVRPARTTTALLIRHGRAGDRAGWKGPDAERPLDEVGSQQAQRIAAVGTCFGVTSVQAADVRRCVQTVAPLAAEVGIAVEPRASWSEVVHDRDRAQALALLRALVGEGGNAAVCSQGGVIPDLVGALTDGTDLQMDRVRSRKGSMWVLSFAGGDLVDAHYLADLAAQT